jgi:hypothetical protein
VWPVISPDTCFTDTARTTAANVGDGVGGVTDQSGNGNHGTQSDVNKQPILRQAATGEYYLEFDGVDDEMTFGSVIVSENWYMAAGVNITARGGVRVALWASATLSNSANSLGLYTRTDVVQGLISGLRIGTGPDFSANRRGDYAIGQGFIAQGYHESNVLSVKVDDGVAVTEPADDNNTSTGTLKLNGSSNSPAMHFYSGVFVKAAISNDNKTNVVQYVANKTAGVTL